MFKTLADPAEAEPAGEKEVILSFLVGLFAIPQ